MTENVIEFKDVIVNYGLIEALHGISFGIPQKKIVSFVGANGAGKTTILKTLSGLLKPRQGAVFFKGEKISVLQPHEIVRRKICHAPEGRGIFLNLSVLENLDLGAWTVPDKKRYAINMERAFEMFPRLKERRKQNAGTLSGGEQQMLAIARALMGEPEVLLLDEPSLGLAPQIIEKIFEIIEQINRDGVTIILVEQNAKKALQIADLGLILETGRIVHHGPAKELLESDAVRQAYLGE